MMVDITTPIIDEHINDGGVKSSRLTYLSTSSTQQSNLTAHLIDFVSRRCRQSGFIADQSLAISLFDVIATFILEIDVQHIEDTELVGVHAVGGVQTDLKCHLGY